MPLRGMLAVLALALLFARVTTSAQAAPDLGDAASFVVLGHSAVVNTGATTIIGNVGVSPSASVEGFSGSMFLAGDVRRNDALAKAARADSDAVDAELAARPCTAVLADAELGGKTFRRGVHCFTAADVRLNGTVMLDAEGDRDAVWIFRFAGSLTTGSGAQVLVIGNGYDGNAFWRTGGAATVGARTVFIGNVFGASIAFGEGARLSGRALARGGSVTSNASRLLLCCAPITVAPATLPEAMLDTRYEQPFTATGGLAPYTFRISSGLLPPGLVLTPGGTLEGTPAAAGRFAFTVTATDAVGCTGTSAYVIEIEDEDPPEEECPIVFTGDDPPRGTACAPYSHTFTTTGAATFIATGLPDGITLSTDGTLSGTTPLALSYEIEVTATHASSCSAAKKFTLRFDCPPDRGAPITIPRGTVGMPYEGFQLPAFSCAAGRFSADATPLHVSESGAISGTSMQSGTHSFDVAYTSADDCTVKRTVTIDVDCPVITLSDLPPMVQGVPYDETIAVSGPAGSFMVTDSGLPAGIVREGLRIHGKPTSPGPYTFVITVLHESGCRAIRLYELTCPAIIITPEWIPDGVVNVPYAGVAFGAIGGTAPYRFSVTSGTLPPDLVLTEEGVLSGVTTTVGTFGFEISTTDARGCTAVHAYSIEVCGGNCPAGVPALSVWALLLLIAALTWTGVTVIRRL